MLCLVSKILMLSLTIAWTKTASIKITCQQLHSKAKYSKVKLWNSQIRMKMSMIVCPTLLKAYRASKRENGIFQKNLISELRESNVQSMEMTKNDPSMTDKTYN